jgi:oxalate decarboxylase/phosphoglucose isomerase-like protein (cupin superfamily)
MYSSIRRYTTNPNDAAAIIELIKQGSIESRIGILPGFVAYYIINCGDGTLLTINVFEEQADAELSNTIAAEWVKEYVLPKYSLPPPEITVGKIVLSA